VDNSREKRKEQVDRTGGLPLIYCKIIAYGSLPSGCTNETLGNAGNERSSEHGNGTNG
jgi:hypothetical protein